MIIQVEGQTKGMPGALLRVDLNGNILQDLLTIDPSLKIRNISISPSGEWIAYRLSDGEPLGGYDITYEFENIEVTSDHGDRGPYQLTQGNGGREVAWSPDSTRLAYGDYDKNRIMQLFISALDGNEREQITQFNESLAEIRNIQWSPDGEEIAFSFDREGNISDFEPRKTDVVILSSINKNPSSIIAETVYLVNSLWWQNNDVLIIYGYEDNPGSYGAPNDRIFWVDASTGHIINILRADSSPGGYMEIPHMYDQSQTLGFFTFGKYYSYNMVSKEFILWDNVNIRNISKDFILRDWIHEPDYFQGGAVCK